MGKKKNKKIKIPKKILGLKVPKQPRKAVNAVLGQAPASQSQPTLAMVVGLLATAIAKQLEGPIKEFLDRQDGHKDAHRDAHKDAARTMPEQPQPPSAAAH